MRPKQRVTSPFSVPHFPSPFSPFSIGRTRRLRTEKNASSQDTSASICPGEPRRRLLAKISLLVLSFSSLTRKVFRLLPGRNQPHHLSIFINAQVHYRKNTTISHHPVEYMLNRVCPLTNYRWYANSSSNETGQSGRLGQ